MLCLGVLIGGCTIKVPSKRYDNLLLNAGYIDNLDTILDKAAPEMELYRLQPGDVVADIGAGQGWFEGYLMITAEELDIYAEDIDKRYIKNMHHVVDKYATLRPKPQTNTIHYVLGTTEQTNLPPNHFDKIIIRETFHHFSEKDEMLQDILSKLKCDGKLCLYEPKVEQTIYSKACESYILDRSALIEVMERNGFVLMNEHDLLGNPGNVPPWIHLPKKLCEDKTVFTFAKKADCN